jgi:GNAT superfamily N-acetyltransferase
MNGITVRPMRAGDLPAVLDLLARPDMDDGRTLSEQEAGAVLAEIAANPHHALFVAEAGGEVVGTFALVIVQHLSHRGGRSAVVEDVVVRSDWQGKGVGRAMMRHAAERATEAGCYKLALSSGVGRAGAHRFYERLGFERHGYSFRLPLPSEEGAGIGPPEAPAQA